MRAELVVDALQMATWRRHPRPGTVVHSDRGSAYTSSALGHRLRAADLLASMGRVASSVDNAMVKGFWSTMPHELLDTRTWANTEQLSAAIFEWVEGWYPRRDTPAWATSPLQPSKPFTTGPLPRHDHPTRCIRRTGSGSQRLPLGVVGRLRAACAPTVTSVRRVVWSVHSGRRRYVPKGHS